MALATISRTDLARRTRQVIDEVRRSGTIIVQGHGEEHVAILDVHDYRLLRAVAAYHNLPPHRATVDEPTHSPRGVTAHDVDDAVAAAQGEPQARWNLVISAYMDGEISLGRAAQLLGLSRFELMTRCNRLDIPLHLGAQSAEEALAELATLTRP